MRACPRISGYELSIAVPDLSAHVSGKEVVLLTYNNGIGTAITLACEKTMTQMLLFYLLLIVM